MSLVKQIGLKEIAYELNVSVNTVSRALRDCDDISEEMKKKVREKAIAMGYSPNNVDEYVKKELKKSIAFVGPDFNNTYFTIMCNELVQYMDETHFDFNIIISNNNTLSQDDLKRCILQRIDGIISFNEPTAEAMQIARLYNIPMVVVGRNIDSDLIDQLYTDDFEGGKVAGEYLFKTIGCKKTCFLTFDGVECGERRFQGFKSVADELGYEVEKIFVHDKNNIDVDYLIKSDFDGIFCFNDELVYLLLYRAESDAEETETIFRKINLVGYDALAHRIRGLKRITSVNSNYHDIAKKAIEIIQKRVLSDNRNLPVEKICFPVSLYKKKN